VCRDCPAQPVRQFWRRRVQHFGNLESRSEARSVASVPVAGYPAQASPGRLGKFGAVVRRYAFPAALVVLLLLGVTPVAAAAADSSCQATDTTSCTSPGAAETRDPTSLIGDKAPSLSGKSLVAGKGTVNLGSLLGKPTAVVFWLNTCPHCIKALPEVNRLRSAVSPAAQIVTASIDAPLKGRKGYTTPAAATKTMHLSQVSDAAAKDRWHVAATPTAFIIDSSGAVTQVLQGDDDTSLANAIRQALAATQ
jgi:thiol-disulfide isomerase/thioredoxin